MATENITIDNNKDPIQISNGSLGVIYIEKLDDEHTQWTTSPENDAWHNMKEKENYQFSFSIYIRKVSSSPARLVVTK